MKRRPSGSWQVEIRDKRLRGGRMSLSARTSHAPTARKREAALRTLLDRGMADVVDRVRTGAMHVADVQRAVERGDCEIAGGATGGAT